jgi:hypothetical protein
LNLMTETYASMTLNSSRNSNSMTRLSVHVYPPAPCVMQAALSASNVRLLFVCLSAHGPIGTRLSPDRFRYAGPMQTRRAFRSSEFQRRKHPMRREEWRNKDEEWHRAILCFKFFCIPRMPLTDR